MRERDLRALARVFNDAFGGILDLERVEHGLKEVYAADLRSLREGVRNQVKARMNQNLADPIFEAVAADHSLPREALLSRIREPHVCAARWDLMQRLRKAGLSLHDIAALVDRDHSTVIHGLRQAVAS